MDSWIKSFIRPCVPSSILRESLWSPLAKALAPLLVIIAVGAGPVGEKPSVLARTLRSGTNWFERLANMSPVTATKHVSAVFLDCPGSGFTTCSIAVTICPTRNARCSFSPGFRLARADTNSPDRPSGLKRPAKSVTYYVTLGMTRGASTGGIMFRAESQVELRRIVALVENRLMNPRAIV